MKLNIYGRKYTYRPATKCTTGKPQNPEKHSKDEWNCIGPGLDQTHQYNGIKWMLVFSRGNEVTTAIGTIHSRMVTHACDVWFTCHSFITTH